MGSQLHSYMDETVYQHVIAHVRFASTNIQMLTINYNIRLWDYSCYSKTNVMLTWKRYKNSVCYHNQM